MRAMILSVLAVAMTAGPLTAGVSDAKWKVPNGSKWDRPPAARSAVGWKEAWYPSGGNPCLWYSLKGSDASRFYFLRILTLSKK